MVSKTGLVCLALVALQNQGAFANEDINDRELRSWFSRFIKVIEVAAAEVFVPLAETMTEAFSEEGIFGSAGFVAQLFGA